MSEHRNKRRKQNASSPPDEEGASTTTKLATDESTRASINGDDASSKSKEEVKELGLQLWHTVRDAVGKDGRTLSVAFIKLPSKRQYPDYYTFMKQPISLEEIKANLEGNLYPSLEFVRKDFELCFKNAKKYNQRESVIWRDAKALQKIANKTYEKLSGADQDVEIGGGDDMGNDGIGPGSGEEEEGSKKSKPNLSKTLRGRWNKITKKTDDSGRFLSEVFMELPSEKLYPTYYTTTKNPLAFDTIQKKNKRKEYTTAQEFADDLETLFSNAMAFNQENSQIWEDALTLRNYSRQVLAELPAPFTVSSPADDKSKVKLKVAGSSSSPATATPAQKVSTSKASPNPKTETTAQMHGGLPIGAGRPKITPNTPKAPSPVHQPAPQAAAPAAPTQPPAERSAPPVNSPYAAASAAGSTPAPPKHRPPTPPVVRRPLQSVTFTTKPLGRQLELSQSEGVRSWAIRLAQGEDTVRLENVNFKEPADQKAQLNGATDEQPLKARTRGKKRKSYEAQLEIEANDKPGQSYVKLDGAFISDGETIVTEWEVPIDMGSHTLEIGERNGDAWKVYIDRLR